MIRVLQTSLGKPCLCDVVNSSHFAELQQLNKHTHAHTKVKQPRVSRHHLGDSHSHSFQQERLKKEKKKRGKSVDDGVNNDLYIYIKTEKYKKLSLGSDWIWVTQSKSSKQAA